MPANAGSCTRRDGVQRTASATIAKRKAAPAQLLPDCMQHLHGSRLRPEDVRRVLQDGRVHVVNVTVYSLAALLSLLMFHLIVRILSCVITPEAIAACNSATRGALYTG